MVLHPLPPTPKGLRPVATGKPALRGRNPWKNLIRSTRPGRGGGILISGNLSTKKLLRPCRGGAQLRHAPTGSASAGFAAPPLYPWLHPSAPMGPKANVGGGSNAACAQKPALEGITAGVFALDPQP